MPHFYDKVLGDYSETEYMRRGLVRDALIYSLEGYKYLKPRFDSIRELCPQTHRLYTTVEDSMDNFMKRHEPRVNNAENNPIYEGKATVAQAFDSLTATRYYQTFRPAMTARLCKLASETNPIMAGKLLDIKEELDGYVQDRVRDVISGTDFEVISIQKLVKVQVGSALITMQNL